MTVVDASAWISHLVWEDEHHQETQTWLRSRPVRPGQFSAPSILLVEVAGAVARRSGRPETAVRLVARLQGMSPLRLFPFDDARRDDYVRLAADLRMRAPDVLYVALALDLGVPLVSWDRQQRERAASVVTVLTPAEAFERGL
jgi:predicted nucleic acid-binding protein